MSDYERIPRDITIPTKMMAKYIDALRHLQGEQGVPQPSYGVTVDLRDMMMIRWNDSTQRYQVIGIGCTILNKYYDSIGELNQMTTLVERGLTPPTEVEQLNDYPPAVPVFVKLTRLTGSNVDALRMMRESDVLPAGTVLTDTTATFEGTATLALTRMEAGMRAIGEQYGRKSHPYSSLHAVIRKLKRARQTL